MNIMYDENNTQIQLGDILRNDDGYHVTVVADEYDGHWYGKLICDEQHACAGIGYHLNHGIGHVVVKDFIKEIVTQVENTIDKELLDTIDGMMINTDHHLEEYKEFEKRYLADGYDAYQTYIFWRGYKTAIEGILHEKYLIERDREQ